MTNNTETGTNYCRACSKGEHFIRETELRNLIIGDVVRGSGMIEEVSKASSGYVVVTFESGEVVAEAGYNRLPVFVNRRHTH